MGEDPTVAILASCLGDGLLLLDGDRVERLDGVPSAGLAGGSVLARALHDPSETAEAGAVALEGGRRLRVPGLVDAHDLAREADALLAVATLANVVLRIDGAGRASELWRATGEGDCWHLSGLAAAGGRALVTAFGRFTGHRDWAEAPRHGCGLVVEVPTGRVVASGLSSPHSPRLVDGALALCDSGRGDLVVGGRRVRLGGWTRGLAVTARHLVVGVSARRGSSGRAYLAFVRRTDLGVERRVELPAREVFDVLEAPASQARRLALAELRPHATRPLRDLRALVEARAPEALAAGGMATLRCRVTNLGDAPFAHHPPFPVSLTAGWPTGRALWSPVPRIEPGKTADVPVRVLAPAAGRHVLCLRLVQEGVGWFDGAFEAEVVVA